MAQSVLDILQKQATAIKAGQDKISAADHLEAAAKLLRAEAGKPANFLAEIRDKKRARLEKFSKSLHDGELRNLDSRLKAAGWLFGRAEEKTGARFYGDGKPGGLRMEIRSGKFSVHFGNELKIDQQELSALDPFLKQQDAFLKIKKS